MEVLSVNELKGLCQQRKLAVSGTKAELIERLSRGSQSSASAASAASRSASTASTTAKGSGDPASLSASSALFPSDYSTLTIPQLKELCRQRLLPVGGIKEDIVNRLQASDPRNMNLMQLKDRCRDATLPVTGTKVDLVERVLKNMSSGTTALLQTKSVEELKELCKERGVAVSGKKDDLIERLTHASSVSSSVTTKITKASKPAVAKSTASVGDAVKKTKTKAATVAAYQSMSIAQLKIRCRDQKLPVGGTRDELLERLKKTTSSRNSHPLFALKTPTLTTVKASTVSADAGYESMMVPQLKELCRNRTLSVMGTKEDLLKRLKEHDDVVRQMFKKRKRPSSDSISSTSSAPAASSTGKRKAAPDEPKTKRIKLAATKKTSSGVTRPPIATNVGAFATPATATLAARKSAPAKPKKTPPTKAKASGPYLVYSTCAYPPDGFHSYSGPSEPKYYGRYATKDEANDRVNTLFYHSNPWGLGADEMDADMDIAENWNDGLLRLEVCPPDSEEWVVGVRDIDAVTASTEEDDDGDVVMVSGSDTEDEYGFHY